MCIRQNAFVLFFVFKSPFSNDLRQSFLKFQSVFSDIY